MASDRMMQAIGALERAISRLEQTAMAMPASTQAAKAAANPDSVRTALRSLDTLIQELKDVPRG